MKIDRKAMYFERMAESHEWDDFANPRETTRRLQIIFDFFLKDLDLKGLLLLDAGSGGGHFSARARKGGAHIVAMDLGKSLLTKVRAKTGCRTVLGDLAEPPFSPGCFDVVLCTEVIEHTRHPESVLISLSSLVKPGGRLVLTSPGKPWQPVVRLATRLGFRRHEGYENFLWPGRCVSVLESTGLMVKEVQGFNILPLFHPWLDPLHTWCEMTAGKKIPWLFVNYGILAYRP
ncbi:MAG: methyltransferase domain-containing protein [Deltaproteobacteria bacterium]|nr:methyltransferase domain-containing protein [Deltaproteobacteria bacterium]